MSDPPERGRFAKATWANVLGNTGKIVAEGGAGVLFGSAALLADAAHSVADLVASLVVLVWGDTRFDAPDADHPHGHARIEPLTALFVGGVIVFLGLLLSYESVQGLLAGPEVRFSPLLVGALGFAMADMYLIYRYTAQMNTGIGSPALRALAADCLNDLYTSVGVLAGIVGVALGAPMLDPVAGALVSLLVVYQGVTIARENLAYLSGRAAPTDRRNAVLDVLCAHDAVQGVHDLAVFYDGPRLEVEAHIEVDGNLTLHGAHDLETELLDTLEQVEEVEDAHLHLDPAGIGEWKDADQNG